MIQIYNACVSYLQILFFVRSCFLLWPEDHSPVTASSLRLPSSLTCIVPRPLVWVLSCTVEGITHLKGTWGWLHVVAAVYFTVLTVFMQLKSPRFIKNNKNVLKIKRLFLFNFQKEKEKKNCDSRPTWSENTHRACAHTCKFITLFLAFPPRHSQISE